MLWLALHLPQLSLEALCSPPPPSAVVSRERIVVADAMATAAGIQPGMRLASAWALLPGLSIHERDAEREAAALNRLACWAGGFTSEVCLLPQTLLLEVAGSLRLFAGAPALFERVVTACREQGFTPLAALAPTPQGAEWLALGRDSAPCLEMDDLHRRLARLPLTVLPLTGAEAKRLTGFGARTLGDVLRLPRAGLARRLGADFAARLARAMGELPDPRPRFAFPERFSQGLELQARVKNAQALGFAGRRLVAALCGWLTVRGAGVSQCILELEHERGARARPATELVLGFTGATRDAERIGRVLMEHLQRLELPAAVEAIRLRADAPIPLTGRDGNLFAAGRRGSEAGAADDSVAALIERLQARLGEERVCSLAIVADHRPENASRPAVPVLTTSRKPAPHGAAKPDVAPAPRPLWLLPEPQALREIHGRPQRGGPLRLLAGPERIESGWWDENEPGAAGDIRRDYFIALSPRSEWLWIFRNQAGWFLHGLFA